MNKGDNMEIILFILLMYLIYNFTKNPKEVISILGVSLLIFVTIVISIVLILKYILLNTL